MYKKSIFFAWQVLHNDNNNSERWRICFCCCYFVLIQYCIWQRMTRWQYMCKSHLQQPWIHMTSNTSIVFSDIPSLYTIFQCKNYYYYLFYLHFFSANRFLLFSIYFHFNCHFEWFINTTIKKQSVYNGIWRH